MKRKGFTLIELLAVIIILGILLLIAIPGVTGYINNSRKNVYVDTAKELIKGTSKLLNSGDFDTLDEDITYYMDSRCIANESGKEAQSPFGKFNPAYVLVVNENDEYNYYFQSRDETEVGVKDITGMDSLEISKIVSNVKEEDIDTSVAVGNTTKVALIDENCHVGETRVASRKVSKDGESMITLTFDNQGGTGCDMQSQYYGEEWGKLCKPKKEGWKFLDWYTKENKLGDKITKTTKAEKSMTVYAAWTDQYATFDTGSNVYSKMRELASGNSNIKIFNYYDGNPSSENMQQLNVVSSPNSSIPIYMWFDNGTIYWWSEDENPYLNEDSSYMFSRFSSLTSIENLGKFDTSKVKDMSFMFWSCSGLVNMDLSGFDTSNVVNMEWMFRWCEKIETLILDSFDTSNVTNMDYMFCNDYKLMNLDVSSFNTSKVTTMIAMFCNCKKILKIDIRSFDLSNVIDMQSMFGYCYAVKEILIPDDINTSNVTNMCRLFEYDSKLISVDVSNFDTSNVTDMNNMFYNCARLKEIDVSNFTTSKVIYMIGMFYCCIDNQVLDVSNFDTSNVTNFRDMFYLNENVEILDVSNFNTSKVTETKNMFRNCQSVEYLDLSKWNTSNVTIMSNMFSMCTSLIELDLTGFDTSNVTDIYEFLNCCTELKTIYASNSFSISNDAYSDKIFGSCNSLVGGNGTKWNNSMASDITYAIIDGKDGHQGLFTQKA